MKRRMLVIFAFLAIFAGCAGGRYQNESRVTERVIVEKPQVVKERVIVERPEYRPEADYYYKEHSYSTSSGPVEGAEKRTFEYREYNH